MLYPMTLTAAPKEEPLTLAEIKSHLRIDEDLTDDDADLEAAIAVAREHIEQSRSLALVTQTWKIWGYGLPQVDIELIRRPLISVDTFKYRNTEGVLTTLDSSLYQADTQSLIPKICPAYGQSWPSVREDLNAVQIDVTLGYGAAAKVPNAIKWAIRLLVANWYEHREEEIEKTFETARIKIGVDNLLGPATVFRV